MNKKAAANSADADEERLEGDLGEREGRVDPDADPHASDAVDATGGGGVDSESESSNSGDGSAGGLDDSGFEWVEPPSKGNVPRS